MKRVIIALLLATSLCGCADMDRMKASVGLAAPANASVPVPLPPPPDPKTQMAALETRIAALVEQERLKIDPDAKPLADDAELTTIARARAQDMATKNYLAHAAPGGETSASLLMAADAQYQGLLGENLAAQHYVPQSGVDPETFAQRFLDEWVKSQPHRENLAFADYDRTGVGAAVNGDTVYVTQLFSTTGKLSSGGAKVSSFDSPDAAKAATPPPPPPLRGAIGSQPQ